MCSFHNFLDMWITVWHVLACIPVDSVPHAFHNSPRGSNHSAPLTCLMHRAETRGTLRPLHQIRTHHGSRFQKNAIESLVPEPPVAQTSGVRALSFLDAVTTKG